MHVVTVVGEDSATLAGRLVSRLAEEGPVASVTRNPDDRESGFEDESATVSHAVGGGGWTASGPERTLDDVVDDAARTCEYLVAEGFDASRYPTVVVGDRTVHEGVDVLARGEGADTDLAPLVEAIEETEPHETLASLVEAVKRSPRAERSGAIATFTGRVRAKDSEDDARTELLEFEKYEGVAEERMAALSRELEEREGVFEVRMHHRTGVIADGEDIVFVVVLAGHRGEAFRTVEDGINRLKDEVPIFKKEVTVEEEFWVHERA
ncbi:molybdopterin synthase [Halomarina litorea]|uniref:molybdopterin synthase n=1 Tax=Halomarina litorea TaxID=2961595 RepID=UPI0020C31A11|nr:molybdopterin synthase [Halomarina sp. BCD28]